MTPDPVLFGLMRHGVSEKDARDAIAIATADPTLTLFVAREFDPRIGDIVRPAGMGVPVRVEFVAPGVPGRWAVVGSPAPGVSGDIVVPRTRRSV